MALVQRRPVLGVGRLSISVANQNLSSHERIVGLTRFYLRIGRIDNLADVVRRSRQGCRYGERFKTQNEVIAMTFEYIEVFYNRKRLHSTLGYKSPMQFLSDWLTAQQQEKLVA